METRGDSRLLRLLNAQRIMNVMFDASPAGISRAEVVRITGLSKPTVSALVGELEGEGVLRPVRADPSGSVGRPGTPYEVVPTAGHALAVDIGGSKIVVGIVDLLGNVRAERQVETPSDAETAIAEVVLVATQIQDELGCTLDAVCVGVPGVYHRDTDTVDQAPNLPGFEDIRVASRLSGEFGVKVWVDNDVNLAAVGELATLATTDETRNFVAISVGTGIGAGLILDGELYRGGLEAAGEVGSFIISTDVEGDPTATLEDLASASGISKAFSESVESGLATQLVGSPTIPEIFTAATTGDAVAKNCLKKAATAMALAVSHLSFVLNPELVIFGGGVGANQVFVDAVSVALSNLSKDPLKIAASTLGPRAAFVGATIQAVETLQAALVSDRLETQR